MTLLIKNATVLYTGSCKQQDLFIKDGKIREIRERITTKHEAELVDATGCIILPGFISTAVKDWQTSVKSGVTTMVRDAAEVPIRLENGECGPLDFLYRVSIRDCNRSNLERLGKDGVKLITLEQLPSDFANWIPRITRLGFVLDLSEANRRYIEQFQVPMVGSYSHYKKPIGARMVVRIDDSGAASWTRGWQVYNRYFPPAYWLDTTENFLPPIHKSDEIKQYLYIHSHFRSKVPAKLLGVFPTKGSIRVGADADLLFFREENLLTSGTTFVPDKVMIKGQFMEPNTANLPMGRYLKGNQTYAFQY